MAETQISTVEQFNKEINKELLNKETQNALLATTFKGLDIMNVKKALLEGYIRGFDFQNFLKKDVYAIPFAGGYSLITSIDYARKIAMRSGQVGKNAPVYTFDPLTKKVETCTVTIQKLTNGHTGEYTATVYFTEYYKAGKNGYPSLWDSKPMTMIAKVAEMHALRQAFPEEFSKIYVEEEMEKEAAAPRIAEVKNEVEKKDLTMGNFEQKNEIKNNEPEAKEDKDDIEIVPIPSAEGGENVGGAGDGEIDLGDITRTL